MNVSQSRNIGAYIKRVLAFNHLQVVAGGGADGVAQNGRGIDRSLDASGNLSLSASVGLLISAVLAGSETASAVVQIQDSDDDGSGDAYADFGDPSAATLVSDGADENGVLDFDIDLSGAKKWVRMEVTVTMSAGDTDTAELMGDLVMAGPPERPI